MAAPLPLAAPTQPRAALPPTSAAASFFALLRLSLRQSLQGPRKWLLLLAGALYPGLLAVFAFVAKGEMLNPCVQIFDQIYLQGILVFICIVAAIPAFSSDAEDATVIYLFSRPVARPLVVVAKWLGALLPLSALALLPVAVAWPIGLQQVRPYVRTTRERVWLPDAKPGDPVKPGEFVAPNGKRYRVEFRRQEMGSSRTKPGGRDLAALVLATLAAVLVYGTFFFAIGVVLRRPYMFALFYAVIFEIIVGHFETRFWVLSKFIRSAGFRLLAPAPTWLNDFFAIAPSPLVAGLGVILVPALALGGASLAAAMKSYISKDV
jgi:hypothetical protein